MGKKTTTALKPRSRNRWNRFVYRLWAPVYDALLERMFHRGRRRAMEVVDLQPGERVCLIGVGTGTDLLLLPTGTEAVGIDVSVAMLARARRKLPLPDRTIQLHVGDAQETPFQACSFDVAILNLILSVVPDAHRCMAETLRILRSGGRVVVFDKFLPNREKPSLLRRVANVFSRIFGTNINRHLVDIISDQPCEVVCDEPSIMGGMYRVILLRKRVSDEGSSME